MRADEMDLSKLLEFRPGEGALVLNGRRMLLFPQQALGVMRSLLEEHFGEDYAFALFFQFGYRCGQEDFAAVAAQSDGDTELDQFVSGLTTHMWAGLVHIEPGHLEFNRAEQRFHMTGVWRESFEVANAQATGGLRAQPFCAALTGYASGWGSAFMGSPCLAIETRCAAQGHASCGFEVRQESDWGPEAKRWLDARGLKGTPAASVLEQIIDDGRRDLLDLKQALDAHAIVSVADRRGVITAVNDLFCEMSGYSRTELLGRTHAVLNSGAHPAEFWREMWHTAGKGGVWRREVCNRAKDGSRYWVDSTVYPLLGPDGKPHHYMSVRTDITARKLAEQALESARQEALRDADELRRTQAELRESQLRMQIAVRTGKVALWELALGDRQLRVSTDWKLQLGYDDHELPDTFDWDDARFARVVTPFADVSARALESGTNSELEVLVTTKRGEQRTLLSRSHVVVDATGEALSILGTNIDITERKRSEERLRATDRWQVVVSTISAEIARVANRDVSVEDMLGECLEALTTHLETAGGWVWTADSAGRLTLAGSAGPDGADAERWHDLAEAATQHAAIQVGHRDAVWCGAFPLLIGSTPTGVLVVALPRGGEDALVDGLDTISHNIALSMERNRGAAALKKAASIDPLTQLPNRAQLTNCLQEVFDDRDGGRLHAVLFIDLDNFKFINDSLGHSAGDELLVETAARLRKVVRSHHSVVGPNRSLVARFGGDEFVVVLDQLSDPGHASIVATRILTEMSRPFVLRGQNLAVRCSIGVATSEREYLTVDELLRDADTALYHAKAAGKAHCVVFDDSMHVKATRRLQIETELSAALGQHRIECHYQPLINLRNGVVIGFEALMRWNHPVYGMVPPGEFIPLAEENGLIVELGAEVLRAAAEAIRVMSASQQRPVIVNVNVSRRQLMHAGFLPTLADTLDGLGDLRPCLRLEITESAVSGSNARVLEALRQAKALGVEIHLDDFGTGLSSLSLLRILPIDGIKIDRSFLEAAQDNEQAIAILHAIIALGHNLRMTVTAEGISAVEQLSTVLALNCDVAQGYLFGRPQARADALLNMAPRVLNVAVDHDV